MSGGAVEDPNSNNTQLLQELEALSQSLYQAHATRRAASLALPRSAVDPSRSAPQNARDNPDQHRARSRRMSLSTWRSRPKQEEHGSVDLQKRIQAAALASPVPEKKGIWNWRPIRALSHIGMRRLSCLFSVEVVAIQGLPASMNGLRLSVCVRKRETRDGLMQTMPARVLQGAADFEETLFFRCHVYCSSAGGKGNNHLKFEPRPFLIYAVAIDAGELNFGRSSVDLSLLLQESMEKSLEGLRIKQWDMSFDLFGKAKGGELVLKLGFQIMDDKGVGIFSQNELLKSSKGTDSLTCSSPFARKQSKSSFSVTSPRISSKYDASTPSGAAVGAELQEIDDLILDDPTPDPTPTSAFQNTEPERKMEDLDLPEFEIIDKGVEVEDRGRAPEAEPEEVADKRSVSGEIVKEVVHDPFHLTRLTVLDSIAQQIKALESMFGNEDVKTDQGNDFQGLDSEEETVTREFLQLLEEEDGKNLQIDFPDDPPSKLDETEAAEEAGAKVFLSDLGKGLGSVVQTSDGGYLASMNPFGIEVPRKEMPKLAMQISKPLILPTLKSASGFDVFQKMAALGVEELTSKLLSIAGMDDLIGKTAEQVAFEGVASAIIHGRNKEGATSSAARSIATVKTMVTALSTGRKERISTQIWNVSEDPVPAEGILPFSLQMIEALSMDSLKILAGMGDEAPFEIFSVGKVGLVDGEDPNHLLGSAISLEEWVETGDSCSSSDVTLMVVVQLRDPLRRYEAVGSPVIALVQAERAEAKKEEGARYKVLRLHMGGLKIGAGAERCALDAERQRLTAMQWLVEYGMGKGAKKGRNVQMRGQDSLWSISARVMEDMWLKPIRNPDVKLHKRDEVK